MPDSTSTSPASEEIPSANADGVGVVCDALDRAWSAVMLYEVGHAARTRAMDACLRAVRAVGEERVVVRVCEQGWQHPTERGGASLAGELARVLHSLDVIAIELGATLEEAGLAALLETLRRARAEAWRGASLEGEVRASVGDAAVVVPVRTSMLTLVQGELGEPGMPEVRERRGVSFSELADALLQVGTNPDVSAGGLEEKLTSMLAGATMHGGAPRELDALGHRLAELPEHDREIASARLAKWMGSLPSETRDTLLAMNGETSPGVGKLLHTLAGKLPIEQIISALERSANPSSTVNARHNLLLFAKLSNLAMDKSVDLQKRVLAAMDRLGAQRSGGEVGARSGAATLAAVEQLLQPNHADDFTPSDYRHRLQSLSQHMLHAAARSKDPEELSLEQSRVRVGEITEYLVEQDAAVMPSAGLLTNLGRSLSPSLSRGQLNTYLLSTRIAREVEKAPGATEEQRASAKALRAQTLEAPLLHSALATARRVPSDRSRLLGSLDTLGPQAVECVAEYLRSVRDQDGAHGDAWVEVLERWIEMQDRVWTSADLVRWTRGNELSDRTLLAIARRASSAVQIAAMDVLSSSDDTAVRRRAFALWDSLCSRWSGALIRHAILDRDPEISARGQARLERGASTAELCGILRSLALAVSEEEAKLAQAIARVLERAPQDDDIRKALKMWRYSPVRLRASLLRKGRKGAAA